MVNPRFRRTVRLLQIGIALILTIIDVSAVLNDAVPFKSTVFKVNLF
jgi:hypothetical protein